MEDPPGKMEVRLNMTGPVVDFLVNTSPAAVKTMVLSGPGSWDGKGVSPGSVTVGS